MAKPALTIALILGTPSVIEACHQWLPPNRYQPVPLSLSQQDGDLVGLLEAQREGIDAIVIEQALLNEDIRQSLLDQGLLFPAVVVGGVTGQVDFHPEEVHLPADQLEQLGYNVDAAISRFLRHGQKEDREDEGQPAREGESLAGSDAWKLSRRLEERLGYMGVFYKRDPSRFLANLPPKERRELNQSLQRTYRDLLISYFRDPAAANQALESFVNTSFFGDLPITRAVEIHMNMIDEFGNQLRLEGRKNDFLQDYRLALLDVMAHLCEMYRRSIPADIPLTAPSSVRSSRDASDTPEVSS